MEAFKNGQRGSDYHLGNHPIRHRELERDYGGAELVLLFTSRTDHVIPPISWQTFLKRVGSDDVTEVICHDSYHVATLDNDADRIFADSLAFIQRLTTAPSTT